MKCPDELRAPVLVLRCRELRAPSARAAGAHSGVQRRALHAPRRIPNTRRGELPASFGELTVFSESLFPRAAGYTLKLWEAGSPETLLRTVNVGRENQNRADLGDLLAPGKSYVVEATSCGNAYAESFEASIRTLTASSPRRRAPHPIRSVQSPSRATLLRRRPGPGPPGADENLDSDAVDLTWDPGGAS